MCDHGAVPEPGGDEQDPGEAGHIDPPPSGCGQSVGGGVWAVGVWFVGETCVVYGGACLLFYILASSKVILSHGDLIVLPH